MYCSLSNRDISRDLWKSFLWLLCVWS